MGRREEAQRDPADDDSRAEARHLGRDRLRPRHRCPPDRRRWGERASTSRSGHDRHHPSSAAPRLHRARSGPCHGRGPDCPLRRQGSGARTRRARLRRPRARGGVGPIGIGGSNAVTTVTSTARTSATAAPTVAELLSRLEFRPSGPSPAWLTQARHASLEWATARGFPTLKDEDWKYTRLGPLLNLRSEGAGDVAGAGRRVSPAMIDALTIDGPAPAWCSSTASSP